MDQRNQKILQKAWREAIALGIASLAWLLAIFGVANDIYAAILVIVGFSVIGYEVYRKYYQYEERIDSFENSKPVIIPVSRCAVFPVFPYDLVTTTTTISDISLRFPKADSLYPWLENNHISGLGADPTSDLVDTQKNNQSWFALVEFRNQPPEPIDTSVARDVSAHITYYNKDKKPRIKDSGISGRWWSNEEVALSEKPRKELERTDILPNSQAVTLALACMGVGESEIYGYNNDNHEYKNFKKTEFTLGPGLYYIHVELSGINLKPTDFWFSVWRDTMSGEMKINKIDKPKGIGGK